MTVSVCICVFVVCVYVCVWPCGIGLMSCRDLSDNAITMIATGAFTDLLQLQTLFVCRVNEWMCVCVCAYVRERVLCGVVALWDWTDVLQVLVQQRHHNDCNQCVHQPAAAAGTVCAVSMSYCVCVHMY